jgi:hypothetical protein
MWAQKHQVDKLSIDVISKIGRFVSVLKTNKLALFAMSQNFLFFSF